MDHNIVIDRHPLCVNTLVEGQFRVRYEIWDQDGSNQLASQQLSLSAPPELGYTTPFWIQTMATSLNFTSGGGPSFGQFQVEVEPVTPGIGFSGTTPSFDPASGERAWIRGSISAPSRLRITVSGPGGSLTIVEGPFRQIFNVDWTGLDAAGAPMAPGPYTVTVTDVSAAPGTTAAVATTTIVLEPAPAPRLRIDEVSPVRWNWEFPAGPLTLRATASAAGTPEFTASPGECKDKMPAVRTFTVTRPAAGPFWVEWDGNNDYGVSAGWGRWCLRLGGVSSQGPYDEAAVEVTSVEPPLGLKVVASAFPAAPALDPSQPPEIRAFAIDGDHQDRYAYSFVLTAAPAPPIGGSGTFAPVTVPGTCFGARSCAWRIPSSLLGGAVAWSVTVSTVPDASGAAVTASTGFRITDLVAAGPAVRVDVPANIVPAAATAGPAMIAQRATTTTLDVAVYPGTGLLAGDPTGGAVFQIALERAMAELKGFGGTSFWRFQSSVQKEWDLVAVWAVPSPVTILTGNKDKCSSSATPNDSFAEVVGVVHGVACRDNAPGRGFTARWTRSGVFWHEFHHSAFDEYDEYCCDGGYADGVNVYQNQTSCIDKSSNLWSCHEMESDPDPMTGKRSTNGWWRSDTGRDDVMWENRNEYPDDRRAAQRAFDRCRRGEC